MTDKQKIRAEIGKLKSKYNKESDFRTVRGDTAREVLDKLLSFIDSLPEEPASEDLEEYAKKLAKGAALDKHNLIWMCKKGAEWQKQEDEKLFKEDSWNYIEEYYPDITKEEKLRLYDISIKSRLAGAKTQKKLDQETI